MEGSGKKRAGTGEMRENFWLYFPEKGDTIQKLKSISPKGVSAFMGENKEYMTHPEELGAIHISEEVLASLAAGAATDVEGISGLMNVAAKKSGTRGVRLVVDEDGAVIDVYILIRYGYAIPEVAGKIQSAISGAIESMTGFSVKAVNVHVGGVSFQ